MTSWADFFAYFSVAIIVIVVVVLYRRARRRANEKYRGSDRMHFTVHSLQGKLNVNGEQLLLTPTVGKGRTHSLAEITHIDVDEGRGIRVYSDKEKLFSVDSAAIGLEMFISYLIENGVKVPDKINLPKY